MEPETTDIELVSPSSDDRRDVARHSQHLPTASASWCVKCCACARQLVTHPTLRALVTMLVLTSMFTVAQFVGARLANSIAMVGDSGTMLLDSLTYIVNLITEYRKINGKSSSWRLELFSSAFSVIALYGVTGFILYDGIFRLCCDPGERPVNAKIMFGFTFANLVIDVVQCYFYFSGRSAVDGSPQYRYNSAAVDDSSNAHAFHAAADTASQEMHLVDRKSRDQSRSFSRSLGSLASVPPPSNLNMDAAFVHLFADTLRTVTVLISSILVWAVGTNSVETDAISSIVVSVLIFFAGLFVTYEMFLAWHSHHGYGDTESIEALQLQ